MEKNNKHSPMMFSMSKMPHFFFLMCNICIACVPRKSLFGLVFGDSICQYELNQINLIIFCS